DQNWVACLESNGVSAVNAEILDPLGRCVAGNIPDIAGSRCSSSAGHSVIQVPIGTLYSNFPGFSNVFTLNDASANSIRHAGYISVVHRPLHGLTWSTNYTYGNSIDDASNASPDKNVLTSSNLPGGQITFGGTPSGDRAVSTFDVKHTLNVLALYDLPFGHGQRFMRNVWTTVDVVLGGWTVAGVERFYSGFPSVVTQAFANDLGTTVTHYIRPNLFPGIPLVNLLFDPKDAAGARRQAYSNPQAFEAPPADQHVTANRTR